jgi:hypothetical protein
VIPFDIIAIPLCEVTVNDVYEMNLAMVVPAISL